MLEENEIRKKLNPNHRQMEIRIWDEVDSTNQRAKEISGKEETERMLLLARHQTAGRGRRGRSFLDVEDGTVCMSLLVEPKLTAADAVLVTTACCVAVWRAIRSVYGICTDIKWVNDLYFHGKKICGILTEAVTEAGTGKLKSLVIGIGLNFCVPQDRFPEDIREIAGALFESEPQESENTLIAEIVNQFFAIYEHLSEREYMDDYREHSILLGKEITLVKEEPESAYVLDIDRDGALIVRMLSGEIRRIDSGEVTVRTKEMGKD